MIHRTQLLAAAMLAALCAAPALGQTQSKAPAPKAPAAKAAAPKAAAAPAQTPQAKAGEQAQIQALMDPKVEEGLQGITQAMAGKATMNTLRGRLDNGKVQKFTIQAKAGTYYVAGACDEACTNLDLRMLGPDGKVVHEDDGADNFPLTQASVTGEVRFDVEVVMKACSKDPCAWAVRIFKE